MNPSIAKWQAARPLVFEAIWPLVSRFAPSDCVAIEYDRIDFQSRDHAFAVGVVDGLQTCQARLEGNWINSRGGERFLAADVPSGFFCLGCQEKVSSGIQYAFAMWRTGDRKFSFYDQITSIVYDTGASPARTADRLQNAIHAWTDTEHDVIFSGPWGWYDLASGSWHCEPQ